MNILSFLIIMFGLLVGGVMGLFSAVMGISQGFDAFWTAGTMIGLLIFVLALLAGISIEILMDAIG